MRFDDERTFSRADAEDRRADEDREPTPVPNAPEPRVPGWAAQAEPPR